MGSSFPTCIGGPCRADRLLGQRDDRKFDYDDIGSHDHEGHHHIHYFDERSQRG